MNSYLIQNEDKTLKMKKLKKLVLESLVESGISRDKSDVNAELELKVRQTSILPIQDTIIQRSLLSVFCCYYSCRLTRALDSRLMAST